MKNILLSGKTANAIDRTVERVLRDIGNPEPPLNLDVICDRLKLAREYYTSSDDGLLTETVHRMKVAGVQILKRPSLLMEAVRKFDLKALYLPDQKRILLDNTRPALKQRWDEAHEIGHSLCPWHGDMMLGDDSQTLSPVCHAHIEAEANFTAGQLVFLKDRFLERARETVPSIEAVQSLHPIFGNTLTTTLWRYVEQAQPDTPMVGVVTSHPHPSRRKPTFNPANPCRYTIQSPAFAARFSGVSELELFGQICSYCGPQRGGPLGERESVLTDDNGNPHVFRFETFFNGYDALTLAVWRGARPISVLVRLA